MEYLYEAMESGQEAIVVCFKILNILRGEELRWGSLRTEACLEILKHAPPSPPAVFTFAMFQADRR